LLRLELSHRSGSGHGGFANCDDLVRIARAQGLKARVSRSSVKRVQAPSLPVIARGRDGAFFVIGRLIETGVLVGHAGGPPVCTENLIRVDDVTESPKLAE
jgi:ATP-binding cassette, subfamily B, bacterial HlyB/CyaB